MVEPQAEKNSLGDFYNRMDALMQEAKSYGVEGMFTLIVNDRLEDTEAKRTFYNCGPVTCFGLCEYMKRVVEWNLEK